MTEHPIAKLQEYKNEMDYQNIDFNKDVVTNVYSQFQERMHCRVATIIFNLPKDMRSLDVLRQADWHPLSYSYKLVLLFKLMHKAFHDKVP